MGGRGSSFDADVISAMDNGGAGGKAEELIVAGMTPTYRGSRYTVSEKTLKYIEQKKQDYEKEQLQILDEYGYITKAYQGNERSVAIPSEAMEYMDGKIVTHNHPGSWGGTFSGADIGALQLGQKELRASAKEGVYSIKQKKDANPQGLHQAYQKDARMIQEHMRKIAYQLAERKWFSETAYKTESRRQQLEVIHRWYSEHAGRHGYEYTFTPWGKE